MLHVLSVYHIDITVILWKQHLNLFLQSFRFTSSDLCNANNDDEDPSTDIQAHITSVHIIIICNNVCNEVTVDVRNYNSHYLLECL